jgi:prepilin peptidase CpaA
LLEFLTVVALVGGAMGVAILAGARIGPAAPAAEGPAGAATTLRGRLRSGLPYGPAIAVGGLWIASRLAGA